MAGRSGPPAILGALILSRPCGAGGPFEGAEAARVSLSRPHFPEFPLYGSAQDGLCGLRIEVWPRQGRIRL